MKKSNIKYFVAGALLAAMVVGCKDQDYEDYKIQSDASHGNDPKIISTAVTATSNSEFLVYAVLPTHDEQEFQLIPVVLNSKDVASQDIHVTLVENLDSLDSYNAANNSNYLAAGSPGSPAFTLEDNGVVTIPKGSSVGYLKIKAVSFDFLGADSYAFSYKIASVQEPGYVISGNHNFGIVVFIAKNAYDGLYHETGNVVREGNPPDEMDTKDVHLATRGLATNVAQAGTDVFGNSTLTYLITTNSDNTVTISADPNAAVSIYPIAAGGNAGSEGVENSYDPTTKTYYLNYEYKNGSGLKRTFHTKMVLE